MLLLAGLLAGCGKDAEVEAPIRPTIGVVVPLSGPNAAIGESAVNAVRLATGDGFLVLAVDDTLPGAAATLAAKAEVGGVVAHIVRSAAETQVASWLQTDLPVIVAAPGDYAGVPRIVPPIEDSARCATKLMGPEIFWPRTDGSQAGMRAGAVLMDTLPRQALPMETVDQGSVSGAAARLTGRRARMVVWTGDAAAGGNFVRVLRGLKVDTPFVGVGMYDSRFLTAAGASAEGALVTSESRPAIDPGFVAAYERAFGGAPLTSAVDAYDAALLLIQAWQEEAAAGGPITRERVKARLPKVVVNGAGGPMYFDEAGVVRPVVCASFRVTGGRFVIDAVASEAQ